jgi:hypothetical protein
MMDKKNTEENGMEKALRLVRDSLHTAAEKPEKFWIKQQQEIGKKIQSSVPQHRSRLLLVWASALMMILLGITVLMEKNQAPAASFAGGSDQELLIEVERALNRNYSEALYPATIFSEKIPGAETQNSSISK